MTELATNVLSYGDNLDILRRCLPETCVDLVDRGTLDGGTAEVVRYRATNALRARPPTRKADQQGGERAAGRRWVDGKGDGAGSGRVLQLPMAPLPSNLAPASPVQLPKRISDLGHPGRLPRAQPYHPITSL